MQHKVTMQFVGNTDGSKQVIKGGYVWHKWKAVSPRILFLNMYFMCVWYHIEDFYLFTAENEKDKVYMRNTVCMSSFFFPLCGWRAFISKWMAGTNCVFNKFSHKLFINSTGDPRRSTLTLFLRRKITYKLQKKAKNLVVGTALLTGRLPHISPTSGSLQCPWWF